MTSTPHEGVRYRIFGSCVTRDAFEFAGPGGPAIETYFARSSIASAFSELPFEGVDTSTIESSFQRRIVEWDLGKNCAATLASADFDVLVIDLIDERFDLLQDASGALATRSNEFLKARPAEEPVRRITAGSAEFLDLWVAGWRRLISIVDEAGLRDAVVVHEAYWAERTESGATYTSVPPETVARANDVLGRLYGEMRRDLAPGQFVRPTSRPLVGADDHKWGRSPFHYPDWYYEELISLVNGFTGRRVARAVSEPPRTAELPLADQLRSLIERTESVPYDLTEPVARGLADELTALCWKYVRSGATEAPPWVWGPNPELPADREHFSARVYEALWLARLSSVLTGAADAPTMLDAVRRLQAELHDEGVPARSNLFLQAAVAYRQGDWRLAKHLFGRGNSQYVRRSAVSAFFSYTRSVDLLEPALLGDRKERPAPRPDACIVVAADSRYIARFLKHYAESLVRDTSSGRVDMWLDWVRGDDDAESDQAHLAIESSRRALQGRLHVEEVPFDPRFDPRTYLACRRFIAARPLLRRYGTVLITDIDYEVSGPLADFLATAASYDVCATRASWRSLAAFFPWLHVLAGTVVVRSTVIGEWFLGGFENALEAVIGAGSWTWGADQNILSTLVRHLPYGAEFGNLRILGQPFSVPRGLKQGSKG